MSKIIYQKQARFGALLAICIGIVFLLKFYIVSADVGKIDEKAKLDSEMKFDRINSVKISRESNIAQKDTVNAGAIARNLKFKKVNINSADISELMKLRGVGRTLASRIVKYREKNGPFKKIDELIKVNGLGRKKLGEMRDFIEL